MIEAMTATHQFSKNDFILSDIVRIVHLMSLNLFPYNNNMSSNALLVSAIQ